MPSVAYFSMEIAVDPAIPTYAGGLGVLAGDTVRAAADLGLPFAAVTLVHRQGYFHQHLDATGQQTESPAAWSPEGVLEALDARARVVIAGRPVAVRAWRKRVRGHRGHVVPVYFLDTDLDENAPEDRRLTDLLYGGDDRYRLAQEAVLGLGGVAILKALGHHVDVFHLNEGHAALLTLALLADHDAAGVKRRCVFTTHTTLPAGHDRFTLALGREVLGEERTAAFLDHAPGDGLSLTHLALAFSHTVNGVSLRHAAVASELLGGHAVAAITNGVHAATWAAAPLAAVFDRHVPAWRDDNGELRYASLVPLDEIAAAHEVAKGALLAEIERRSGARLDEATLTIGFARRATAYKRADLVFRDVERLREVVRASGPLQLVFAGKAHPRDLEGKKAIRRVFHAASLLSTSVRVVYLAEHDMALAKLLCSGVDVWLNNPLKPNEASGTSGMKAALNGVPSLSVRDGWWAEGCVEGVTGWAIGGAPDAPSDDTLEAASLYDTLEHAVAPLYYGRPLDLAAIRRNAIALNGSFFSTHRMVREYLAKAYAPAQ